MDDRRAEARDLGPRDLGSRDRGSRGRGQSRGRPFGRLAAAGLGAVLAVASLSASGVAAAQSPGSAAAGAATSTSTAAASAPATAGVHLTAASPARPAASLVDTATCTQAGSVRFAKTKFLLHAGLAFGAFHRYIYKPFKAGILHAPTKKKLAALAKGGVAAVFVYHELKLAKRDAEADKTLCKLVAPLDALGSTMQGLGDKLKHRQVSGSDIQSAATSVDSLGSQSASLGAVISDKARSL